MRQYDSFGEMIEWIEESSLRKVCLASPVYAFMMVVAVSWDPAEKRPGQSFAISWGSAMASSGAFGGLLLSDVADRVVAAVSAAAEDAVSMSINAIAAEPLAVPSFFALLSVVGFAWSAVLYSRERGEDR